MVQPQNLVSKISNETKKFGWNKISDHSNNCRTFKVIYLCYTAATKQYCSVYHPCDISSSNFENSISKAGKWTKRAVSRIQLVELGWSNAQSKSFCGAKSSKAVRGSFKPVSRKTGGDIYWCRRFAFVQKGNSDTACWPHKVHCMQAH